MKINNDIQDWDDLADLDPFWAIATHSDKKFDKWKLNDFFHKGNEIVDKHLNEIKHLDSLSHFELALDFGCGTGRLTRALAKNVDVCYGVDISEKMISLAKNYNHDITNCKFFVNHETNLSMFPDNKFDFILSLLVLQHISDPKLIKYYIQEFIRILKKNGLIVFQLPSNLPFIIRNNPKKNLYKFLSTLGFKKEFLFKHFKIHPLTMNFLPEQEVTTMLNKFGCKILKIDTKVRGGKIKFPSTTYYVTK